nr:unnamed protein product [Spirometra erinaceieuropaei]
MFVVENDRICRESAVSVGEGGRVSAKAMRRPVPAAVIQRRTRQSLVSTMPAQCFIRPSIQRSPQYTVHAAQAHSALTWFSPPVETVARGVAAEQSPATWSHRCELGASKWPLGVVLGCRGVSGETTPSVHLLALNSHLWLHVAGLCSAATPRATVSTGGLNQVTADSVDGWSDGTPRRRRRDEALSDTPLVSRRGSAWYAVDQPVGWISELAPSTRAHLVHRRRPQACGNATDRVSPLTLAAWNVRSLLDNPRSNRPERRTALVARELARYKVDIAALNETRFSEQGQLEEMVRQLHDGMMARVTDNGAVSEAFAVTNGVKQGCVLAPTLFSLMFSAMLMDAYRDERPGIRIAY